MFRFLLRVVGVLLLACAFAALIVDGTRSVGAGEVTILPLGDTVSALFPEAFAALRTAIEKRLPGVWDPYAAAVLRMPTWIVLGGLGFVLLLVTRRRAPKIGYSRR